MNDPLEAAAAPAEDWLLVEDEALVAMALEDAMISAGVRVVGPCARIAEALAIAKDGRLAGALLDVNVAGELIYPVAEALRQRGIPFAFITGYGRPGLREDFRDCLVLQKPFLPEQVRDLIASARQARSTSP